MTFVPILGNYWHDNPKAVISEKASFVNVDNMYEAILDCKLGCFGSRRYIMLLSSKNDESDGIKTFEVYSSYITLASNIFKQTKTLICDMVYIVEKL